MVIVTTLRGATNFSQGLLYSKFKVISPFTLDRITNLFITLPPAILEGSKSSDITSIELFPSSFKTQVYPAEGIASALIINNSEDLSLAL